MKKILVSFLLAILISGCNDNSNESAVYNTEGIPTGAIQETFEDNPDLIMGSFKGASGNISAQGTYYKGMKHGSWTEYHENGVMKSTANYDLGVLEGVMIMLDPNGQIETSTQYHNGKKHGRMLEYIRSGVKTENNYINDQLEGTSKSYYANGNIMEIGNYTDGQRNGISQWFDQEGNLTIEYEYQEGKLIQSQN